MVRIKTEQLSRLMSEVISLRERVAQAELAAANSRILSSGTEDGGDNSQARNMVQARADFHWQIIGPENLSGRDARLRHSRPADLLRQLQVLTLDQDKR
jgi:hypothetical protein